MQMFNLLCEKAENVHVAICPIMLWYETANTAQVLELHKLVAVIRFGEISFLLVLSADGAVQGNLQGQR